jgi:hypothetical protein
MSSVWAWVCSRSSSSSSTGGSWATAVCTCSEWVCTRASAVTAPPLEPRTTAGPASRWLRSRERSSARSCGVRVLVGVVDRATVDAPWVGGEHGVVYGQEIGQRREGPGVHRGADQHHKGTLAAHLVMQTRARDLEGPDCGGSGRNGGHSSS